MGNVQNLQNHDVYLTGFMVGERARYFTYPSAGMVDISSIQCDIRA